MRGQKVGLTSKAMQQMLGVDEPDYGHLLDDMLYRDGASVPVAEFLQPRVEVEIAFQLARTLRGPGVSARDVLEATDTVAPSIEIIDSAIADWKIKLHAVARVVPVEYAEIVATVASAWAGPGTRANIDEFTGTTARAIESVGGARRGKAIIILNPADPPLMTRDTILCSLPPGANREKLAASIVQMEKDVQSYVPGYRLLRAVSARVEAIRAELDGDAMVGFHGHENLALGATRV